MYGKLHQQGAPVLVHCRVTFTINLQRVMLVKLLTNLLQKPARQENYSNIAKQRITLVLGGWVGQSK